MTASVQCPGCQSSYRLPEGSLGRRLRCKKCGKEFAAGPSAKDTKAPARSDTLGSVPSEGRVDKLGRFLVQKKLGQGSFGTVYLAFDPVLDREVAIKVPRHGDLLSEQDQERFLREAKAAGRLRHPNIVPVYDAGNDDGQLFIASAFIEGLTLEKRLEQGRLEFAESARLVIALAEALDYAHGQETVHRDVKPANILLDAKGLPLLMDFGLARLREAEDRLTHDGTVLGTPAYMAPEQAAARADEVGASSDQYSLGVVLYELLCEERPFEGPPALVISMVINQEPPSPKTHNSAIPRDLETICLKAMAKSPQHRYASCQQLADDLRRWLNYEPVQARRVSLPERFVRWCRREPIVSALAVGLLITVSLGAGISSWSAYRAWANANNLSIALGQVRNSERLAKAREREATENLWSSYLAEARALRRSGHVGQRVKTLDALRKAATIRISDELRDETIAALSVTDFGSPIDESQSTGFKKRPTFPRAEESRSESGKFIAKVDHETRASRKRVHIVSPDGTLQTLNHPSIAEAVLWSPDDGALAVGCDDGRAYIWDRESGRLQCALEHAGSFYSMCFSSDGQLLLSPRRLMEPKGYTVRCAA